MGIASFARSLFHRELEHLVSVRCASGVRQRFAKHLVHPGREGLPVGREEVAVAVVGHLDRGMPELGLDRLGIGSSGDEQGGAGVPEIMRPEVSCAMKTTNTSARATRRTTVPGS